MNLSKPRHQFEAVETLLMGGLLAGALHESVRLGLYDLLETPKRAGEVATNLGTHPAATEALLSLLAQNRLLRRHGAHYSNTPVASEFLVRSSPFYQGTAIDIQQSRCEQTVRALPDLLKEPGQARPNVGKRFASPKAVAGMMQHAVRGSLQDAVGAVSALPGFAGFRHLCDIGGNHGQYALALLGLNPLLRATIADLPEVTEVVAPMLADVEHGDRLSFLPCDLHVDALPEETYDIVLASLVLQIFADDLGAFIARIRAGIVPGGWFVSQNLDFDNRKNRFYTLGTNLMSRLMAGIDHCLLQQSQEEALRNAGFRIVSSGSSGNGRINRMLIARKND